MERHDVTLNRLIELLEKDATLKARMLEWITASYEDAAAEAKLTRLETALLGVRE